jgi:hypothetical protein
MSDDFVLRAKPIIPNVGYKFVSVVLTGAAASFKQLSFSFE